MSNQSPNISPKPEAEDVKTTFDRWDNRWDIGHAHRDWVVIGVLVIIYLIWTGTVFFLEPGIR
jgi:hypothetical protein